ncbi:MAG: AAC(3) family N-acetyltransferase [Mobilitalea sp.]
MSEADVIKNTKSPYTQKLLIEDIQKMGVKEGETILVHSSMSRIGWVCGEERTVIEALQGSVSAAGTICMPAHSGGNSDPADWCNPPVPKDWYETIYENMPAFDLSITPTRGIGRIAEAFRIYPGTIRSNHPHTSFCANGKQAKEITEGHVLSPQFGKDSPLGKLYELNAKVLLLGVEYDSCTSFHMGEVFSGKTAIVKMGAATKENGRREWIWFEDYDYDNEDFKKIGEAFEAEKEIVHGKIGNAECRLFDIKDAVDFAVKWMRENR